MKFNPNRYDLILLFAVVSGIYYVIDETLNNAPPRRTAETLPVVFSVDASPQTAATLVQGLIKSNQWCHVPVGARQAWDFALVDTELNGEAVTAVYRLDGAPAWDVVYAGGAAAWRRAERLKHARWQLEVDEYRVAHGLVGDVE